MLTPLLTPSSARLGLAIALAFIGTSAAGAPPLDVLNKYGCSACHGMTQKVVGPGFNAVAAKYKDQKDAAAHLTGRIRAGGSGTWGAVPMPPQPTITDAEVGAVVAWLLAGAAP